MKLKIFISTLLLIFLSYLAIYIAGFLPFIAEYKKEFEINLLGEYTKYILLNPIESSMTMINAENPLFYICMGAALIMFFYILYKSRTKDYETVGEKYGVQGSSRWAKKAEVFKVPEQITILSSDNMYDAIKQTLNDE